MLTHKFSYIVVLGPYFGYWVSLLGPYSTKKWVLIGSLPQSLGVFISFRDSETGGQRQSHLPHYLLPRSQNLRTRLSEQNGLTKGEYNLNQMFYFDVNHRADMDTL